MIRFASIAAVDSAARPTSDLRPDPDLASTLDPDLASTPDPDLASTPDPALAPDTIEADLLTDLADEITTLAARIHAATHRLLTLLAEFDRRRGWEREGHSSCAHWLSYRTGIDLGASRERVRTARALTELPMIGAAMARGELSFSKVRALTRVATPEEEGELLAFALESTTATLERAVRGWKKRNRTEEGAWERALHESRTLSVFPDEEGMYLIRGKLDPEVGALLMRAIEAAGDALYREDRARNAVSGKVAGEREAAQRRADAVGLLAERALSAGFGGREVEDEETAAPISGTRAERYQVVLHVETCTLTETEEPGRSELEDGTRVSAETSRRLSCDAGLVRVAHASDGSILDVGRRTRTISPALRRALDIRDRGCRFPGCELRFTDAHHVRHWADGGETSLDNCALLCRLHHRLVHEGGWRMGWWGQGRPVFYDPRGGAHYDGRFATRRELRASEIQGNEPRASTGTSESPMSGPVVERLSSPERSDRGAANPVPT